MYRGCSCKCQIPIKIWNIQRLQYVDFRYNYLSFMVSVPVIIGVHKPKDRLERACLFTCPSVCPFFTQSIGKLFTCSTVLCTKLHYEIDSILFSKNLGRGGD